MPDDTNASTRPKFFDSKYMEPAARWTSRIHTATYRATGGLLGGKFRLHGNFPRGVPVCLLTTTGRKTGKRRTKPLVCLPDGERVILTASWGGTDHHPKWYLNVLADPEVHLQLGRHRHRMRARTAEGEEREQLWKRLVEFYPEYGSYQTWTERVLPVVVCEPAETPGREATEAADPPE